MTDFIKRMMGVLTMSFDLPLWLWPVSVVLVAAAAWSIWSLAKTNRLGSRYVVLAVALSAIAFIGFPAYAVTFWADRPHSTPETQELPVAILGALWWAYVLCMLIMPVLAKGLRLPVAALAALMVWVNLGVAFVCAMAVSGSWL
jgi:hypothetical protein